MGDSNPHRVLEVCELRVKREHNASNIARRNDFQRFGAPFFRLPETPKYPLLLRFFAAPPQPQVRHLEVHVVEGPSKIHPVCLAERLFHQVLRIPSFTPNSACCQFVPVPIEGSCFSSFGQNTSKILRRNSLRKASSISQLTTSRWLSLDKDYVCSIASSAPRTLQTSLGALASRSCRTFLPRLYLHFFNGSILLHSVTG